MLSITLITVGNLKERYLTDACGEYIKRLGSFCKLTVLELPEHKLPQNPSPAEIQKALHIEGAAILAKVPKGSRLITLCIEGKLLSSEQLAAEMAYMSASASHFAFVIGSSHGIADTVKQASHLKLSMSRMTFPHQLARVMLLEQLYRASSINAGMRYHK